MKGKRAATFVMIAIVAVIMVIAVLLINQTTIFQEGNPLPVISGIWQLSVNGEQYAQIKDEPATFITKTSQHDVLFSYIESNYNVKYKRQTDAGYVFVGEDKNFTVTVRSYSRLYRIWQITKE